MNTHTIVADMHQNMLKTHVATDGRHLMVSDARSVQYHRANADYCVDSEQVSDLSE